MYGGFLFLALYRDTVPLRKGFDSGTSSLLTSD